MKKKRLRFLLHSKNNQPGIHNTLHRCVKGLNKLAAFVYLKHPVAFGHIFKAANINTKNNSFASYINFKGLHQKFKNIIISCVHKCFRRATNLNILVRLR